MPVSVFEYSTCNNQSNITYSVCVERGCFKLRSFWKQWYMPRTEMYKLRTNREKLATRPDLAILIPLVQYLLYLHFFFIYPEQQRCNFHLVSWTVVTYRVPLTYSLIPFPAQVVSWNWGHRPVIFTFRHISRKISKKKRKGRCKEVKRRISLRM